jgi:hypothetical protein
MPAKGHAFGRKLAPQRSRTDPKLLRDILDPCLAMRQ